MPPVSSSCGTVYTLYNTIEGPGQEEVSSHPQGNVSGSTSHIENYISSHLRVALTMPYPNDRVPQEHVINSAPGILTEEWITKNDRPKTD